MMADRKKGKQKTQVLLDRAKSKYLISSLEYELRFLRQKKIKQKKKKKSNV